MFGHVWRHNAPHPHHHHPDPVAADALAGEPLKDFVIDVHSHPGPGTNFFYQGGGAGDLLRVMDRTGVDYSCFSAYTAIGPDFVRGNELVAKAVRDHPDRVIGFAVPNPNYPELAKEELIRRVDDQGFRGIKIHSTIHEYPIHGPNYIPVYEFADDHRLPILSHTYDSPARIRQLATTYPNARFIWAHAIWQHIRTPDLALTVRDLPNVFCEMSGSGNRRGQIEAFVKVAGVESAVFGSDYPVLGQTWQMGNVAHADLTHDEKRKIFSENIRGVLGL